MIGFPFWAALWPETRVVCFPRLSSAIWPKIVLQAWASGAVEGLGRLPAGGCEDVQGGDEHSGWPHALCRAPASYALPVVCNHDRAWTSEATAG